MKTILFILGAKVENGELSQRLRLRLDWAVEYYSAHKNEEKIVFLVTGRCGNILDPITITEAAAGKRYILQQIPKAQIITEEISVEIIGNFAFSKPIITASQPDKVIIITSDILEKRVRRIAQKIFADSFPYSFQFIRDELSGNPVLVDKEAQALRLFNNLFMNPFQNSQTS